MEALVGDFVGGKILCIRPESETIRYGDRKGEQVDHLILELERQYIDKKSNVQKTAYIYVYIPKDFQVKTHISKLQSFLNQSVLFPVFINNYGRRYLSGDGFPIGTDTNSQFLR